MTASRLHRLEGQALEIGKALQAAQERVKALKKRKNADFFCCHYYLISPKLPSHENFHQFRNSLISHNILPQRCHVYKSYYLKGPWSVHVIIPTRKVLNNSILEIPLTSGK